MKKQLTIVIITFLFSSSLFAENNSAVDVNITFKKAINIQYINSDSAIQLFEGCLPELHTLNDSTKVIDASLSLIRLYTGNGNYQKAYDLAWALDPWVQSHKYLIQHADLKKMLATLYLIFLQLDKAHIHLEEAISLAKQIEDPNTRSKKLSAVYATKSWFITNKNQNFEDAKHYLQLAIKELESQSPKQKSTYPQMQLAELYTRNDSLSQAYNILKPLEKDLSGSTTPAYSLLYAHLGQLYLKLEDYDSAAIYFHKGIKSIDFHKNHLDNKTHLLDALSVCYHHMGQDDLAYHYSQQAKIASEQLFGSKNSINKELFEIKDRYQEQLREQRITLLEEEKKVLRLKTLAYISILLVIIGALIFKAKTRSKKQKFIREKENLEKHQQLKELEARNKELMASALQLLERDTMLNDIKTSLDKLEFKAENKSVINGLMASINANKAHKWKEFDLYFTQINDAYYQSLKHTYPKLSATDLKMCALIKIGLSSKEMADIMGISPDSIKTSRSRIRKKMNLTRDINLSEHLSNI